MKKIMFGLLALLSGCTTESVSYEYKDGANNVAKKTYIGGNLNNLELIEYKDHEYLVYHTGADGREYRNEESGYDVIEVL